MEKEIWKAVPNYEGMYEISSYGNVKSIDRIGVDGRILKGKILHKIPSHVYVCAYLYKDRKVRKFHVHQLVAMSFLGHIVNKNIMVINHIDGNKLNNHIENIEIVTQRANLSTCFRKDRSKFRSKYIGVCWHKVHNKWVSKILINGRIKHLGYYSNEIDASIAYQNELSKINQ